MDFSAQNYRRPRPRRRPVAGKILLAVLFLGSVAYLLLNKPRVISPLAEGKSAKQTILHILKPEKNPDALRKIVKDTIGTSWNNYSVYVVDLNSPFSMGINETTIFTGASINKVPILAALYAEAQKGNVDFDKIITLQAEDIQDYGTGSIRYDPPGTTYSVKTLARLMMQKSDNTAAHLLGNYIVGLDTVQAYVNQWGMKETDMVNNKTSNKDMAILFTKIINEQITTPAYSEEMLGFLKDSDFEDRIPALLPKGVTVYHKVGTGTGTVHDVGVVTAGKTTYYIGIFTSDIIDEEQASKLASEVSRKIYDFMTD